MSDDIKRSCGCEWCRSAAIDAAEQELAAKDAEIAKLRGGNG